MANASCEFCKNPLQPKTSCPHCGNIVAEAVATFVYGQTKKQATTCEIRVTDKYIIVRSVSKKELATATGAAASAGFLGALIAEGINGTIKKCYGYYDLREIQKAIFPYRNSIYKKDTALKIVNKDGTDFLLYFNMNGLLFSAKAARNFAAGLARVGVYIENGASANYGAVFCARPFVDENTLGRRVCASAASFVQLDPRQFVVSADTAGANQGTAQTSQAHAPTAAPTSASVGEGKACPECGKRLEQSARFCDCCGHAFAETESAAEPEPASGWDAEQWKNRW